LSSLVGVTDESGPVQSVPAPTCLCRQWPNLPDGVDAYDLRGQKVLGLADPASGVYFLARRDRNQLAVRRIVYVP